MFVYSYCFSLKIVFADREEQDTNLSVNSVSFYMFLPKGGEYICHVSSKGSVSLNHTDVQNGVASFESGYLSDSKFCEIARSILDRYKDIDPVDPALLTSELGKNESIYRGKMLIVISTIDGKSVMFQTDYDSEFKDESLNCLKKDFKRMLGSFFEKEK